MCSLVGARTPARSARCAGRATVVVVKGAPQSVTALPGFIDWAVGIPSGVPAKSHGLTHMLLNVTALVVFIINALIHTGNWTTPTGEASGIILALLGVLCTVGAGYFGWIMIQTDHVGVVLTPEQERLERGVRTS